MIESAARLTTLSIITVLANRHTITKCTAEICNRPIHLQLILEKDNYTNVPTQIHTNETIGKNLQLYVIIGNYLSHCE